MRSNSNAIRIYIIKEGQLALGRIWTEEGVLHICQLQIAMKRVFEEQQEVETGGRVGL